MNKKRLVFTDLDGTLLGHYTYQTEPAEETITALKSHNIPIIPNSSKTLQEILLIRQQLNLLSPFIIENGAAVYIPVNYFDSQPEGTHLDNGYWVKPFCQTKEHWLSLIAQQAPEFKGHFKGFSELTNEQLAELTGLDNVQASLAKMRQYGEPLNWTGTDEAKEAFIEKMKVVGANILRGGRFFHVSGHCDKGIAQRWLTEQYQKQNPKDNFITIALGDSDNDSAMLEEASIAVQISSPVHDFPKLNRKEDVYKSRQCGPAGWAESLQKLILSELITH
jgi:mannosyl-3-phosphoglycerate phosphatase